MNLKEALTELRKEKKRNFDQTIDLILNLKGLDLRRDNINLISIVPHKIIDKRVCGFLENKSNIIDTITKQEFDKYKEKKDMKKLVRKYDFFIANAKLMPSVASTFGKVLGPSGKMPSPQLGVITQETDEDIKKIIEKIFRSIKIRIKEASLKIAIAKESMDDEKIIQNINVVYNDIINALPIKKENVRNIMIKLTMSKPIIVEKIQ